MKYPHINEMQDFIGKRCFVKKYYAIDYSGRFVIHRTHKLIMFHAKYERGKRIAIPVQAVVTGFGYGFNGIRTGNKFEGNVELIKKKRVNFILVRLKPNGKEYKVPADQCKI